MAGSEMVPTWRIALMGDVMLGRLVDDCLESTSNPCYVWGDTREMIQSCDLAICNLECVIADSGAPWSETPKVFHFRSHAKNVDSLACAGINIVTLANNHSLDYGYTAFRDMLAILKGARINYAGAGGSLTQAIRPAIVKVGGVRVGVLSFTDDMSEWAAANGKPGIYHVRFESFSAAWQKLSDNIKRAKTECDFLIVSPHWGPNFGYSVQSNYVTWAHGIIDSGADMVFGHSGHIFRGIEIYKNKPIIYSAGDFIDDYAISEDEPNDEGFIYVLELKGHNSVSLKLYPTIIKDFQAQLAETRSSHIANKLLQLSEAFGTTGNFDTGSQVVTIPIAEAKP